MRPRREILPRLIHKGFKARAQIQGLLPRIRKGDAWESIVIIVDSFEQSCDDCAGHTGEGHDVDNAGCAAIADVFDCFADG